MKVIEVEQQDFTIQGKRPLPNGWRWLQLRELLTSLETGSRPKGGARGIIEGVPSLSAEHITSYGHFNLESVRFVPREYYNNMAQGHIRPNDILIVKDGATTGKAAFVGDSFPLREAVVNEHVFLCRPNVDIVFPNYLFLWLWGPVGQSAIRMNYQGAAIGGINQRFASSVLVPVPPLSDQKRITEILNEQMVAVERARSATEVQLEAVRVLPTAYLRAIFNSTEAQEWPRRRIGEVCRLLPSKSISTDGDAEVLAITTACLSETGFQDSGVKRARMNAKDAAECRVSPGEVLVARSNTPELVGRVAMFEGEPKEAVASDLTIRLFPSDVVKPFFLAAYLSFLYLSGHWKERAGGASGSMKKITRHQIREERVPIPSLADQIRVAEISKGHIMSIRQTSEALQEQLKIIRELPLILFRRAFSGNI
jgi:restriction endonuclease S subunit